MLNLQRGKSYRFKWEELILRFFAFFDTYESYDGKLAGYLNKYMGANRKLSSEKLEEKKVLFFRTIDILNQHKNCFTKGKLPTSKAALEALFVGIAKNIEALSSISDSDFKPKAQKFETEIANSEGLMRSTADRQKVLDRIGDSIKIFA